MSEPKGNFFLPGQCPEDIFINLIHVCVTVCTIELVVFFRGRGDSPMHTIYVKLKKKESLGFKLRDCDLGTVIHF